MLNERFRDASGIPIGGQRPQGEIGRVAVIAQIKHAREARRREAGIAPQIRPAAGCAAGIRRRAAPHRMPPLPPTAIPTAPTRSDRGCCRNASAATRLQRIAVVAFAPAAVRVLPLLEPCHGALDMADRSARYAPARAPSAPTRCHRCSWFPIGRTRSRRVPADRADTRSPAPAHGLSCGLPTRARTVTTRAVTSLVGGSNSAP